MLELLVDLLFSVAGGVEARVISRHRSLSVVLVHFGQRVTVCMKLCRSFVPPDREMLFESTSQVATMRCRLTHNLVEVLGGSLPVGGLNAKEGGKSECSR